MFVTYSFTNIGKKRLNNEDRLIINGKVLNEDEHYFSRFANSQKSYIVLADGMGGLAAGEVASEMIVNYFKEKADEIAFSELKLNRLLHKINQQVIEYSDNFLAGASIGSTVAGVILKKDQALIFNAGDSLIYSFENGSYTELSVRHNSYNYQKRINPGALFLRPDGLVEFIGNRKSNYYFPYNIFKRKLNNGEILFLSTDGVTNYYPNPTTLARLFEEEKDFAVVATKIIDYVTKSGSADNFSFAIVSKLS